MAIRETQSTPTPISGTPETDKFVVSDPLDKDFILSFTPESESELVLWNGQGLTEGASVDYTVTGNIVRLNTTLPLIIGDLITIKYTH